MDAFPLVPNMESSSRSFTASLVFQLPWLYSLRWFLVSKPLLNGFAVFWTVKWLVYSTRDKFRWVTYNREDDNYVVLHVMNTADYLTFYKYLLQESSSIFSSSILVWFVCFYSSSSSWFLPGFLLWLNPIGLSWTHFIIASSPLLQSASEITNLATIQINHFEASTKL